jgi:hypothetical protein
MFLASGRGGRVRAPPFDKRCRRAQRGEGDVGQPWLADLSPSSPQQTPHPLAGRHDAPRGAWFWIKQIGLFPFRLLGLFMFLGLLLGGLGMWVIPDLAAQRQVDMVLLVLRILDTEGPARPFRHLGYEEEIHAGLLDLRPDPATPPWAELRDEVVSVNKGGKAGGQGYLISYAGGKTQKLVPATPHTTVLPEELAAARRAVGRLFPDREQYRQVLAWGESLFVTSWVQRYDFKKAPRDRFPGPAGGNEDEQVWCAWQALRSGGAPEEELFCLPELFRSAFPEPEDQKAALAWADTLYERLGGYYRQRQHDYATSPNTQAGCYAGFKRVLPPDTPWSRLWLLQEYVGLSPAARAAARTRWLGYFPPGREEQVLALGTSLIEERRGKGEALPNVPDVLPALCVVQRLTGTDGDGQACADTLDRFLELKLLSCCVQLAYPNDDLFYLLAGGDRLELFPFRDRDRGEPSYYIAMAIFLLVMTSLLSLGVQTAIQWGAARLVLRRSTLPLWKKHLEGRGNEPWYLGIVGVVLLAGVGCLTAPYSIAEIIAVQISSPAQLFFGAVMATACGGVLIAIFRRLAALFFVACGVDVEETWADEILGLILGGLALYHFGNDLLAIGLFALSDLLPGLVFLGIRRLLRRRSAAAPAGSTSTPASLRSTGAIFQSP